MNVMKLMVVALAGWINQQQEDVREYATAASGLADCFATTTGMPREPMHYQRFQFWDTTGSSGCQIYAPVPCGVPPPLLEKKDSIRRRRSS
jgi:hypothetical protein